MRAAQQPPSSVSGGACDDLSQNGQRRLVTFAAGTKLA